MKPARLLKLIAVILASIVLAAIHFRAIELLNPSTNGSTPLTGGSSASAAIQAINAGPQTREVGSKILASSQPLSSLGNPFYPAELAKRYDRQDSSFPVSDFPKSRTLSVAAARRITEAQMASPEFRSFIEEVLNGHLGEIRGVYVEGVLSLPVIQQPADQQTYVSIEARSTTQFHSAARNGVIGLLAHNFLAGGLFYKLQPGQEVWIVYGDGSLEDYQVTDISQYQKLAPDSLHSDLVDLATGQKLTTEQVYDRFYRGDHHVTFQTCLERNGTSNWGLTFVVAKRVE